jgi:hypothetical protein
MKDDANNLLTDVLAEAAPADFREAVLDGTLRQVRRRRQFRKMRQIAAMLAVLAVCGVLVWQKQLLPKLIPSAPSPPAQATAEAYRLVETRPLPIGDIVTTRPLAAADFVASTVAVRVLQTTAGNYRVINDEQLLALLGNRPAILIRTGPHSEELVFANPADERGFPLN